MCEPCHAGHKVIENDSCYLKHNAHAQRPDVNPWDHWGEGSLIKVKRQVDFNVQFR